MAHIFDYLISLFTPEWYVLSPNFRGGFLLVDSLQGDAFVVSFPSGCKFSCFQSAVVEDYLLRTLKAISRITALMSLRANQPIMVNVITFYTIQTLARVAVFPSSLSGGWCHNASLMPNLPAGSFKVTINDQTRLRKSRCPALHLA